MNEEGKWVTIRGRHVFIKNGQTASEAIKEYEENKNKTNKNSIRCKLKRRVLQRKE